MHVIYLSCTTPGEWDSHTYHHHHTHHAHHTTTTHISPPPHTSPTPHNHHHPLIHHHIILHHHAHPPPHAHTHTTHQVLEYYTYLHADPQQFYCMILLQSLHVVTLTAIKLGQWIFCIGALSSVRAVWEDDVHCF